MIIMSDDYIHRQKVRDTVDSAGVGLVIAQPHDVFNAIYFDIVDGEDMRGEEDE